MRPYLSLDIETTGLNRDKSEVLEIGFVADTFIEPVNKLPRNNVLVLLPVITYAEPYALAMNQRILAELADGGNTATKLNPTDAFRTFREAVLWLSEVSHDYDVKKGIKYPSKKITVAGKNVAGFDLPLLKNFFVRQGIEQSLVSSVFNLIDHRVIDVGSVFYSKFGYIPSLNEINKLTEREAVSHRAVEDALDVVFAIRKALGVSLDGVKG